jgi:hypothetical protein
LLTVKVQKLNNPNCYTLSSEPYRIQKSTEYLIKQPKYWDGLLPIKMHLDGGLCTFLSRDWWQALGTARWALEYLLHLKAIMVSGLEPSMKYVVKV